MIRNFAAVFAALAVAVNGFALPDALSYERSELVQIRTTSERSENGDLGLHIRAFEEDHHVTLKLANDIFSPEYRMYTARTMDDGTAVFQSTSDAELHSNDRTQDGHFYSVSGSDSPGSLFVQNIDGLKVEGLLNDRLLIVPHPTPQQDREGNLFDHMVYHLRNIGDNFENDTLPGPNFTMEAITTRQSTVPSTVTAEVLVLFDYVSTKTLNFDKNKIQQYLGIFYNQLQNRYAAATSPNVKIAISGLLTFNSDNDQPFIKDQKIDDTRVKQSFLGNLKDWLKTAKGLPKNDVVLLHTGLDAGEVNGAGQFSGGVAGMAYVGTACFNTDGWNSGYTEDSASTFSGIGYAAHELGHLLSLDHDGESNGAACSNNDGYLMSTYSGKGKNQYTLSSCSLSNVRKFASDKGKCLWDSPTNQVPLSTKSPASMMPSLDDQCKKRFGSSYYFRLPIGPDVCEWVKCTSPSTRGGWNAASSATEGTPCDIQKMCIKGECLPNGVASLDQQCKYFGQEFTAWGKENENICSRLWCTKDNYRLTSIGGAADGSVCGAYGSCLSQNCVGQVQTLDDQCKREFGNEFYGANKDKPNEVCRTLWCTKDGRSWTSRRGADPYSKCEAGKICRDSNCVTA